MEDQKQVFDIIDKQGKFYSDILSVSSQKQEEINSEIIRLVNGHKKIDIDEVMKIINHQYSLVAKEMVNNKSFDFILKYLDGTKGKKIINTLEEIINTFKIDLTFDMAIYLMNNYPELDKYLESFKSASEYESNDIIAILYDVYCDQNKISNAFEDAIIDSKSDSKDGYYSEDAFAMYLHEISKYPLLTMEQETDLFKRYKEGHDENARKQILNSNLRLVVSIVSKRYASRLGNNSFALTDLVQEGNIGLMKAVERFDYKQGFKFSTYATWWIKQNITRALMDKADTVRLPVHAAELSKKIKTYIDACDNMPTVKEIAEKFEVSEKLAKELLFFTNYVSNLASLNTPIGEGEDSSLEDFIESEDESIEESVESKLLQENIEALLKHLTPRERDIVKKRFGIGYPEPYTLEMIAQELSLTRERVRQIQKKAIEKLQKFAKVKTFQGYEVSFIDKVKEAQTDDRFIPNDIKLLRDLKKVSSLKYTFIWSNLKDEERAIITKKYGENFSKNDPLDEQSEQQLYNVILIKINNLYNRNKFNAYTYDEIFTHKYFPKSIINYYRLNDNQKDILAKCYGPYLTSNMNSDINPEDEKKLYPIIRELSKGCIQIEGFEEYQKLINGEFEIIPNNYINLLINLFKNRDIQNLASDKPNEEVDKAFRFILSLILDEEEYLIVSSYFGIGDERLSLDELSIRLNSNKIEIKKKFLEGARKLIASPHLNLIRKRLWEQSHSMLVSEEGFSFYSFFTPDSIKLLPNALAKLDFADIAIIKKYFPNSFEEKITKEMFTREELALLVQAVNNLKNIMSHLYMSAPETKILDDNLYEVLRLCESKFVSADFQKLLSFVDETEQKVLLYSLSRESVTGEGIDFASVRLGKSRPETIRLLKSALRKIASHIVDIDLDLSDIEKEYLFTTIKRG